MIKIIFLDVDGVLNSMDWFEKTNGCKGHTEINPEKVKLLKEIVDRTGAEIVLSSTWKTLVKILGERGQYPQYDYLIDSLGQFGLEIIDHTPRLNGERPNEIKAWLEQHGGMGNITFASLDDDFPEWSYFMHGIFGRLVKTSFYEPDGGLRREHVEKAVEILMEIEHENN